MWARVRARAIEFGRGRVSVGEDVCVCGRGT